MGLRVSAFFQCLTPRGGPAELALADPPFLPSSQDVSVACLLVSSKLEDTLKKLRDIQIAAFQVRAAHEGLHAGGALAEPDPAVLEADRAKLIGVERLILETISFNFNLRSNAAYATRDATSSASQNQDTFAYVVKLGKAMRGACAQLYIQLDVAEL